MDHESLASELLREVKATSKRWFIAFIVMVILEAVTIFGFIWYITLPVDEYEISQQSTDRSFNLINSDTEDIDYGSIPKD